MHLIEISRQRETSTLSSHVVVPLLQGLVCCLDFAFFRACNGLLTGELPSQASTNHNFSNNMLYPREDKENNKLLFECRICDYIEEATQARVFRHELVSNIG